MPSRRRPKAPPPRPLSDAERFAQSLRDSEEADRRAKQAAVDRKVEAERIKNEAIEHAERMQRAKAAHQRSVELVKEAKRTGRGAAEADVAWRAAKAELLELETGKRPAWAPRPAEPPSATTGDFDEGETSLQDVDGASDHEDDDADDTID
jgi:hypothetical protein